MYLYEKMNFLILNKMKKAIFTSILALLIATVTTVRAQEKPDEYLGLPGDNLNLYAVMNLFQESETLEGFERKLNEQNSRVNNLDLNGDNFVDYIMVTDYVDGEDHNIVLSVALNSNEKQDVAVFTVQKLRNGAVGIQLIGDEELYGRNYIIEPIYDDNNGETPNPGYNGRNSNGQNVTVVRTTYYEVATWPMIRFIYRPNYVIWRSSWHWGYYPSYWEPWSPFYYHYYYGYYSNWYPEYYRHYRHWDQPRYTSYNTFYYTSVRAHSPSVSVRIKEGNYKNTYSRPESRRDGEALYKSTRTGSDQRSDRTSTSTNNSRRSESTQSGARSTVSTGTRNNTNNSTGANRRSDNPTTVKARTNSSSGQNAAVSRRQATPSSDRAATKPATSKKSETVSRSRESTTKSATPAKNSETVRRSRESTTKATAPARTTVKASKSESSSRSTKTKEAETTKPIKRR
jgi:hypothetical protein